MKISRDYAALRRDISAMHGRQTAAAIWKDAGKELDRLHAACPELPEGERHHVHGYILPRIAVYRAMSRSLGAEHSMELLDAAIDRQGNRMGSLLRSATALPLMKGVFMRTFSAMAKNMFGKSGGFSQTFHCDSRRKVSFDILDCTYCRWCRDLGCPEVIHTFCASDEHCFGHLTGIDFTRTQTLEHGDRCDFALIRKEKRI